MVITTKNRRQDLLAAVTSAVSQAGEPEVLVVDDGSTDGTTEMLRTQFPKVVVLRHERSLGYIAGRNRAAGAARGDVIFSIDDDAVFTTPRVLEQTLIAFSNPRIGAVAIPFINVRSDNMLRNAAPAAEGIYVVPSYIGTAHAVRRKLFLGLGGYREHLFHQGEESDFGIRLLAAGYVVAIGRSDPIHHFESPRRDTRRMDVYGRRNDILFGWHNTPLVDLPARWLRATVGGLAFGVKVGRPLRMMQGVATGYAAVLRHLGQRRPVSRQTYRLFRRLVAQNAMRLEEVEPFLPLPNRNF